MGFGNIDSMFKYILVIQIGVILFSMGVVLVILWLIGKWLGVW